jgi:hypothetical protein
VLIQSLIDEFGAGKKLVSTPAPAGQTLQAGNVEDELCDHIKRKYQAGVGKLLYLARWSRPEIGNAVRELSRFASRPQIGHFNAMLRVMDYCDGERNTGWVLKPSGSWNNLLNSNYVEIQGYLIRTIPPPIEQ